MWTYNHSAFLIKARKVVPIPAEVTEQQPQADEESEECCEHEAFE
jgi:hypothetical protein